MMLLLEWLSREGHLLIAWWLWITLAGLAVFPLCLRLLGGLPDKGYSLARAIGLLLVAVAYWLMASYGFFDNSRGNIILTWALVLVGSLTIYARRASRDDLATWWRENWLFALVTEILFVALFVGWAVYRAHQNGIVETEKPMELAFMSAVQRSLTFPPQDPWMSGYAISYYYLGYVMSSMLSMMSGIASTIGFNLTSASQFALTGVTAFGVACNLVRSRALQSRSSAPRARTSSRVVIASGLVAMLLMTLAGNFQLALIEIPYESRIVPQTYLEFWGTHRRSGFAEGEYVQDSAASLSIDTAIWEHWWWWRASRVLTDYNLDDSPGSPQPIDEFPAFSFLLADNHPHVLALPFTIMFIGLMLNLVLRYRRPHSGEILLYGVAVGGLAFLNAWDGPIYLAGLVGAEGLRRLLLNNRGRLTIADIAQLMIFGLQIAVIALVAYLPYLIGFRSQASGVLPNLANPTAIQRFFIMFGPLLIGMAAFLSVECWRGGICRRQNWRFAGKSVGGIFVGLALLMLLLTLVGAAIPPHLSQVSRTLELAGGIGPGLAQVLKRHLEYGWTALLLLLGLLAVLARLFPKADSSPTANERSGVRVTYAPASGFALLLIGMGLCLTLIPEFVFLRDNFGGRINTIFKFYYQAWTLWSIAVSYAVFSIVFDQALPRPRPALRLVFGVTFAISIMAGLMYTILGINHRAWIETGRYATGNIYSPPQDWENPIRHVAEGELVEPGTILYSDGRLNDAGESSIIQSHERGMVDSREDGVRILKQLTLDGWNSYAHPHDREVIGCLSDRVGVGDAVVSEAVRDAYNAGYGRVGALTGIPNVLGWVNHERQWRGPTYAEIAGTREQDMDALYSAIDMEQVSEIIDRYQIDYILYGSTERTQYGDLGEELFLDHLPIVCESGTSRVYATRQLDS